MRLWNGHRSCEYVYQSDILEAAMAINDTREIVRHPERVRDWRVDKLITIKLKYWRHVLSTEASFAVKYEVHAHPPSIPITQLYHRYEHQQEKKDIHHTPYTIHHQPT